MANKKFYVDINLQDNALENAKVGTSSSINSLEGAFQYDATAKRLQYNDGAGVKEVAHLGDIVGLLNFKGGYDASLDDPNLTSPAPGAVEEGDFYVVTIDGTFFGEQLRVGDSLIAKVDNPAGLADWVVLQNNLDIATNVTPGIVYLANAADISAGTPGAYAVTASDLYNELDAKVSRDGTLAMTGSLDMATNDIVDAGDIELNSLTNTDTGIITVNANLALATNNITNVNEISVNSILSNGLPILIGATLDLQFSNTIQNGIIDTIDIANGTLTTTLDADNHYITNLLDPVNDQDAATKNYVDDQITSNTFVDDYAAGSWVANVLTVPHALGTLAPKVVAYVSGELVEFAVTVVDQDTITLTTNITAPASVKVGVTV
jgi:hypothetical protein